MTAGVEERIRRQFGDRLDSVSTMNGNEVHVMVRDKQDVPEVCVFARDDLGGRLATVVCSEERPGGPFVLRYALSISGGRDVFLVVTSRIWAGDSGSAPTFPSMALRMPAATLYEREIRDAFGLVPEGNPDTRPLVVHEDWPGDVYPLRKEFGLVTKVARNNGREYRFLRVEGEGVSEIPVGPVHAGIIEPGHFRFSIIGESIVNLETRLFYTHRGIEKLAESLPVVQVVLLSERISGDEAVANSTAYCQAVERIANVVPPPRAMQVRLVCAELERVYNHLGTLAGLSLDVGFAYGSSRLNLLKERMMRLNEQVTGSRLLFGVNRVGGVGVDLTEEKSNRILETSGSVLDDFHRVVSLLRNDSSVTDRLRGTGTIKREDAVQIGLVGVVARSSGVDLDTRRDHPYGLYRSMLADAHHDTPRHVTEYEVEMANRRGDVLARFDTRAQEVIESVGMITRALVELSPETDTLSNFPADGLSPYGNALGYAESHRGQTVHWVMIGETPGSIYRYKVRTASFANWPSIEVAVLNDILADFPLVNKSLDLSYAGNDL